MKIQIEITETDLRKLAYEKLKESYPADVVSNFGFNNLQVKMTYRANETWRRPRYMRFLIEKEVSL